MATQRQPLPSIILANVRSIENKADELAAAISTNKLYRNANVLVLTDT